MSCCFSILQLPLEEIGPVLAAKADANKVVLALYFTVFGYWIIFFINKNFVIFGG
jgi:hypothetical protein